MPAYRCSTAAAETHDYTSMREASEDAVLTKLDIPIIAFGHSDCLWWCTVLLYNSSGTARLAVPWAFYALPARNFRIALPTSSPSCGWSARSDPSLKT